MAGVGRIRVLQPQHIVVQAQFIKRGGQVAGGVSRRCVPEGVNRGGGVRRCTAQAQEIIGRQARIGVGTADPVAVDGAFALPLERDIAADFARQADTLRLGDRPRDQVDVVQVQLGARVEHFQPGATAGQASNGLAQRPIGVVIRVGIGAVQYQDDQRIAGVLRQGLKAFQPPGGFAIGGNHQHVAPGLAGWAGWQARLHMASQVALAGELG